MKDRSDISNATKVISNFVNRQGEDLIGGREGESISFTDEEKNWIETIAGKIKSNFVTMDLVRKEDGGLVVMELGDDQVSGLQ